MHFYPHHIGDFQRDTASLSDSDTMAYLRLIWLYYDTELPLPADTKKLAFKIGSNPDSVQIILDTFFTKEQDFYRHKRCDEVLNEIYDKSDKARLAAEARWSKHKLAMQMQCGSNANASKNNADAPKIDATHNPKPKTQINKDIRPLDVDISIWEDFVKLRKAKDAPITETALKKIISEAKKANWKLDDALTEMCSRGWTGFKADWVMKTQDSKPAFDGRLRGAK